MKDVEDTSLNLLYKDYTKTYTCIEARNSRQEIKRKIIGHISGKHIFPIMWTAALEVFWKEWKGYRTEVVEKGKYIVISVNNKREIFFKITDGMIVQRYSERQGIFHCEHPLLFKECPWTWFSPYEGTAKD